MQSLRQNPTEVYVFEGSPGQGHCDPGKVRLSSFIRRPTQLFLSTRLVLISLINLIVYPSIFLISVKIHPYFRSYFSVILNEGAAFFFERYF